MATKIIRILDKFHGTAVGIFTGDEHYAGKSPSQGTELCAVAEYMFSLELLMSVFGDPAFGDRLEKITYNALPATFTPDMWAHQYDQQANQVLCTVAERQWTNNGPESNTFGTEPNFGCCTANMHQAWPKFVSHLWMATPNGGLAAVAYGPSEVTAKVNNNKDARLTCETLYPFGDRIRLTVHAKSKFPLMLRIPAWAKGATVTVNGEAVECAPGRFCKVNRKWADGDVVELHFPMTIEVEERFHKGVAVKRGPLVYSLKIGEDLRQLKGQVPHADWAIYSTTPWNYGLEVDLANPGASFIVSEAGIVGAVPFEPSAAPVTLKARGRLLPRWKLFKNSAGPLPRSPVQSEEASVELTLIPYGSTNLRVTEFPRIG
jgi:DUF1680 family protein